jgi:hypothetical protein
MQHWLESAKEIAESTGDKEKKDGTNGRSCRGRGSMFLGRRGRGEDRLRSLKSRKESSEPSAAGCELVLVWEREQLSVATLGIGGQ